MLKTASKEHERLREAKHFTVTQGVEVKVFRLESEEQEGKAGVQENSAEIAEVQKKSVPTQKESDLFLAAMAYLTIFFVVPFVIQKRSTFVNFHLRQGIFLFVISVALSFTAWVSSLVWFATAFVLAVFSVTCAVQAARGYAWRFPLVGKSLKRVTL